VAECQVCGSDNLRAGDYCPDCGAAVAQPAASDSGTASAPAATGRLIARRFGAPTGEVIPLAADRVVVGRFDPETGPVDIDLSGLPDAAQISRRHAELYREADGRWYVKDLGSTNGVFVGRGEGAAVTFGPRITRPEPLESGDEIAFGNARFTFAGGG